MTMPGGRSAGQISLRVVPDTRTLGPQLISQARVAAVAAERKAGKVRIAPDTRAFGPALLQGLRRPLKQAGSEGQAAFKWLAAGTVAVGINKAVQAASSLNETVNKSRVVFGPASRLVERFGQDAATSIGMSTQAAIENASTLGNLFVSMKIGRDRAAEMSTTMVRLAGDMASFNNASPQETLDAIRAGLVGETEPLRRFGVNLNEATLKAEAMRLGLGKIGPTLTAQQRTQAAYSLILQQTTTAQGDFARTSDGLANQQRILAARYKDSQATLGTALLPVMLTAVTTASSLAKGFSALDKSTGGLSTKLLLGGAALAGVGYAAAKTITIARDARAAWVTLRAAHLTTAAAATVATGAETRLAGATTLSSASAVQAAGGIGGLRGALLNLGAAASTAFVVLGVGSEQLKQLRGDTTAAGDPVTWLAKQLGLWHGKAKEAAAGTREASGAAGAAKEVTNAYKQALAGLGGQAGASAPKLKALTESVKEQRTAIRQGSEATRDAILSYKGLISQSKVTTAEVIKGIRDQVSNFRTYSHDTQRLIRAGVSPAAIRELAEKGPEYVHALATGSNRELNVYKEVWRRRQSEVRGSFADSMERQYQDLLRKLAKMQKRIDRLEGKNVVVKVTGQWDPPAGFSTKTLIQMSTPGGRGGLAKGGRIMAGTTPTADDVLVRVSKHETVVSAEDSSDPWFKAWARSRRIPGYARGGLVSGDLDAVGDLSATAMRGLRNTAQRALTRTMARGLAAMMRQAFSGALGGLTGPGGWQWQMAVLRQAFPGLPLISGYRRGAITATGRPSYHGFGRAVDLPPRMDVFRWIRANYGARTKELIFTPAGRLQVWNGQPHVYSGITARNHVGHIHWAYRTGAWKVLADRVARIHKGEMIVPQRPAESIRQALAAGGGLGGGLPVDFYERLAAAIAANPPRVYLDRQRVSHELRSGGLWDARRD
jgi:hypothetical protein